MHQPITFAVKRPLLSTESCSAIADTSAEHIIRLAEEGSLVAFDVAVAPAHRRCLRVLASSLADYLAGTHRRARLAETPADIKARVEALFPAQSMTVRTATLARILNVVEPQACRLIRSGVFQLARKGRDGQGNSSLIYRESCVEFLLKRRIT